MISFITTSNRIRLYLMILLLLPVCVRAQADRPMTDEDGAAACKIYSISRKKEISLERLIKDLRKSDVVFFGEEHDDSIAHALQLKILEGLHKLQKEKLSLSMEMFQSDVQLVLDEYTAGLITEKNLQADARPWKNYADYRPLVEYARENRLYVLAANAPSRYTNRVSRGGLGSLDILPDEAKALLAPLPVDTLTGRYHEKFGVLMRGQGHASGIPPLKLYQSQNLWDATMAWRIARLSAKRPGGLILHLNGRFHSDERLGTYAHLKKYAPELNLRNISVFPHESFDNPDWTAWEHLADFIVITRQQAGL